MLWNAVRSVKKYSTPSLSPCRGRRAVCETENFKSVKLRSKCWSNVVLPDPEGAETMYRFPRIHRSKLQVYHKPQRHRGYRESRRQESSAAGVLCALCVSVVYSMF